MYAKSLILAVFGLAAMATATEENTNTQSDAALPPPGFRYGPRFGGPRPFVVGGPPLVVPGPVISGPPIVGGPPPPYYSGPPPPGAYADDSLGLWCQDLDVPTGGLPPQCLDWCASRGGLPRFC